MTPFDIAQLDAAFHLKALGGRRLLRVPLGVPDWGAQQKFVIAASLFQGKSRRRDADCARALEDEIRRVFGVRFCIATGSGREAIKLALLGLGAQPGERVVLPSFCCLSVLLPVLQLGLEPVLADVGEDLQIDADSVRRVMRPGDRALIVPHLFGALADMPQLVEIAQANHVAVIDDAAQAIGLRGAWGWAGRGGNAGIFSFGLCKPLNAMGGGALLTDDEKIHDRALKALQPCAYENLSRVGVVKAYVKTAWRKSTYRLFLNHRLRQQQAEAIAGPPQVGRDLQVRRIGALHARLAASQLAGIAARRRQAAQDAETFKTELARIPSIKIRGDGRHDGFPRFVVRVMQDGYSPSYADIFSAFLQRGIEVQPTYRPLHRILQEMGMAPQGEFRRSERLAETLVSLPFPDRKRAGRLQKAMMDMADGSTKFDSLENQTL